MIAKHQAACLFLYGSLLTGTPDRRLNRRVKRLLRHAAHAVIQARLYNLGRYPGVIASPLKADRVYGRVVIVNNPHLLRQLDHYEGYIAGNPTASEFVRDQVQAILLPSRKRIDCWVYLYNRDVQGKERIASGDYVHYRSARNKW